MTSGIEQPALILAGAAWFVSEVIMMPVMYISCVAMLLLAVLYATGPSRRPRASAFGHEDAMQERLAEFVGTDASGSLPLVADVEHTSQNSDMDQKLRQMEVELALLRGKVGRLEQDEATRREDRPALGAISRDGTAAIRKELEALRAELSGDS